MIQGCLCKSWYQNGMWYVCVRAVLWEPEEGIRHSGTGVIEVLRSRVGAGNPTPEPL